jgi:hypothetical protein
MFHGNARIPVFGGRGTLICLALALAGIQVPGPIRGDTARPDAAARQASVTIRGELQVLRLSGPPGGTPVIVSSGDGGWIHLAPHVAALLSGKGYFVVGFDTRAYLSSFTNGSAALRVEDEPADYKALIAFASRRTGLKPFLIGVSEGAGLSVLAATDASVKTAVAGIVGLGLSDATELGWRWRDAVIYFTHGAPREPTFSVRAVVGRVAPAPLAMIHSSRDEFVPLSEARAAFASAGVPKRMWVIDAADHRFSDKLPEFDRSLLDALEWIGENTTSGPP